MSGPGRADDARVVVEDATRSVEPLGAACGEVRPGFLGAETMAILGCGRAEIARLDGRRLFVVPIGENATLAAVARDGSRFAILEPDWVWREFPRLRGETIRVYDVGAGTGSCTVRVAALRGSDFPASSGAALSPDGSLLVVNSMGRVALYRLPPGRPPVAGGPPPP